MSGREASSGRTENARAWIRASHGQAPLLNFTVPFQTWPCPWFADPDDEAPLNPRRRWNTPWRTAQEFSAGERQLILLDA